MAAWGIGPAGPNTSAASWSASSSPMICPGSSPPSWPRSACALRAGFAVRLVEHRLFTYATRGEEHAGRGAIIAAIDCSGSMTTPHDGVPGEARAKACALAFLDTVRAARRHFAGILFSAATQVKVFRFPAGQAPIGDVPDFSEFFWYSGTDFQAPLDAAADLLEADYNADGTQRGDIVLVTDGHCGISEDRMRHYHDRKNRLNDRTFGVAIASQPGPVLGALCDNVRGITDLTEPAATRDMFRVI